MTDIRTPRPGMFSGCIFLALVMLNDNRPKSAFYGRGSVSCGVSSVFTSPVICPPASVSCPSSRL